MSDARLGDRTPLHRGPPALGVLRLAGRMVWTRLRAADGIREADLRSRYESGVEFANLNPEQNTALAGALATLQAIQVGPGDAGAVPPLGRSSNA